MQPGPGHRAGVDATQLLPDGREEGAGPLQVIQEQRFPQWSHTVGRGQVGARVRGQGGQGPAGSLGASAW